MNDRNNQSFPYPTAMASNVLDPEYVRYKVFKDIQKFLADPTLSRK